MNTSLRSLSAPVLAALALSVGCYAAPPTSVVSLPLERVEDALCLTPNTPVSRDYSCSYTLSATPFLQNYQTPPPGATMHFEVSCQCQWDLGSPQPTCGEDPRPLGLGDVCRDDYSYAVGTGSGVVATAELGGWEVLRDNYAWFSRMCRNQCGSVSPDQEWRRVERGYRYLGTSATAPSREWTQQVATTPTWTLASQMVCCAPPARVDALAAPRTE